jgi:hypothetical protein
MLHRLIEILVQTAEAKMVKLIPVAAAEVASIPEAAHHKVDQAARELS